MLSLCLIETKEYETIRFDWCQNLCEGKLENSEHLDQIKVSKVFAFDKKMSERKKLIELILLETFEITLLSSKMYNRRLFVNLLQYM